MLKHAAATSGILLEEYRQMVKTTRDCIAGQVRIRNSGQLYLPRPSGMSSQDYLSYVARAQFPEFVARAMNALTGRCFRKPGIWVMPESLVKFPATIDGQSMDWKQLASWCFSNVLATGRVVLVLDPVGPKGEGAVYP